MLSTYAEYFIFLLLIFIAGLGDGEQIIDSANKSVENVFLPLKIKIRYPFLEPSSNTNL
jgi:hypothetical protein